VELIQACLRRIERHNQRSNAFIAVTEEQALGSARQMEADCGAANDPPPQNTSPFDIFGLPTISVPCGFTNSGLPIGLQISGARFAEATVLSLARAYERETEWHNRRPPVA
jgi:Asp-tRNA(Asn)/Glu-tRNA(Gln) amidotransferase A subunit family amidase